VNAVVMNNLIAVLEQLSYQQMREVSAVMLRLYRTKDFGKERAAHKLEQEKEKAVRAAEVKVKKQVRQAERRYAVKKMDGSLSQKRFASRELAVQWVMGWCRNEKIAARYQVVDVLAGA
jgi:hypothetical protein